MNLRWLTDDSEISIEDVTDNYADYLSNYLGLEFDDHMGGWGNGDHSMSGPASLVTDAEGSTSLNIFVTTQHTAHSTQESSSFVYALEFWTEAN